jgi:hypothetical protein
MVRFGEVAGRAVQRAIQIGVSAVGRRVPPDAGWLRGPVGSARIGRAVYDEVADALGLARDEPGDDAGLLPSFALLRSGRFDPGAVDPRIHHFYEHTARYGMEVWSRWNGPLQVLPRFVVRVVSSQILQFNLPLSAFDNRHGFDSEIIGLRAAGERAPRYVGWLRTNRRRGTVVYAGFYSACLLPSAGTPHVRVVFPLPRGSSTVLLRPEVAADRSFVLVSDGRRFGDCGAYRVHHGRGARPRAVLTPIKERIHVYVDDEGALRTDHTFGLWSRRFLTLHYKMVPRPPGPIGAAGEAAGEIEPPGDPTASRRR